ncbi:CDP-diacylglycerol--serine O-phosphatidyltransferase, partial [Pseudoalteromonas ruthenica]
YRQRSQDSPAPFTERPFIALGRRTNKLKRELKEVFHITDNELVLYTPYDNYPTPLVRALRRL